MNRISQLLRKWLFGVLLLGVLPPLYADFNPDNPREPFVGREVTVQVDPKGVASASGAGTFQIESDIYIQTWSPQKSYHFQYWTLNGIVFSNSMVFSYHVGDSAANFVAHYIYISPDTVPFNPNNPPEPYLSQDVKVLLEPSYGGYASGGGAFMPGQTANIKIIPTEDYAINYWTINSYPYSEKGESFTYHIGDSSVTFIAHLVQRQSVRVSTFPRAAGTSSMQYMGGDTMSFAKLIPDTLITLRTYGNTDYVFREWQLNGYTFNSQTQCTYSVSDSAAHFVAVYDYVGTGDTTLFNPDSPLEPLHNKKVQITVLSSDSSKGNVTGSGFFHFAAIDTLIATPVYGYTFQHWENGDTSVVRIVTAERDTIYKAWFGNDTIDCNPVICYQDTFFIADTAFTQTGYYEFYAMTSEDLISLYRINLTVLDYKGSEQWVDICEGDTLFVGSQAYTRTGDYAEMAIGEHGCDSTVIWHLIVHPIYNDTIVAPLCAGESYILYNFDEDTTGVYTQYLQSVYGCDSLVTLNLTVYPVYDTTFVATICQGDTYLEHGFSVGSFVTDIVGEHFLTDSLLTIHGCDSLIYLILKVDSIDKIHHYDTICQGDSLIWGMQYVKEAGDWFYEVPAPSTTCGIVYNTLHLFVHPALQVRFNADNNFICHGESDTLSVDMQVMRGTPVSYDLLVDAAYQRMGLASVTNSRISKDDTHLDVSLSNQLPPGNYSFVVLMHDSFCYDFRSDTIRFSLFYNSDSLITQRWNDFLSVRKSAYDRYGGFCDYQWYKDGVMLNGETSSQLYIPEEGLDLSVEYAVELTRMKDGVRVMSCGFKPDVHPNTFTFKAWPTFVLISEQRMVNIQTSLPGRVSVYNTQGTLIFHFNHPSGIIQMPAPSSKGLYIVHFIADEVQNVEVKQLLVE